MLDVANAIPEARKSDVVVQERRTRREARGEVALVSSRGSRAGRSISRAESRMLAVLLASNKIKE